MTPAEFVAKWNDTAFGERQASQEMFLDICGVVEHPTPGEYGNPEAFTFEKWVPGGFADAYLEERFGWEFKGDDADLDAALNQLLRYQVYLKTPPLLIVSSFKTIRIRTNFPGMATELHEIPISRLDEPENLNKLRYAFHAPVEFRPDRSVDTVTRETTELFHSIVEDMELHNEDPEKLARYLNQMVFCLYADAANLLPDNLFTGIVRQYYRKPPEFAEVIRDLFERMADGGRFGAVAIPHFNGNLFDHTEAVELSAVSLQRLVEAAGKNWQDIEPSIFGTLFERALDASKRSQLGAHYTSAEDIMLVVEPVVMAPLRREWETARREVDNLISEEDRDGAEVRLERFRRRLFDATVLDPACGSGNFLYLALRSLLDLEKEVIDFAAARSLSDSKPRVKPDQMLGLEVNPYAAAIARTALWIGYIQWHKANGFDYSDRPILTPLHTIHQTDAILDLSDPDNPREPEWPAAEFIIGNPPFLGGKLLRTQLGDEYVNTLFKEYDGRVPAEADLVCYWFERGRATLEGKRAKRVGLLATQGIRGGANRRVLQRIKETGDIFLARSDHPWVLNGAAVHISIVGFDDGLEINRELDGSPVESINANLTAGADLTNARPLAENIGAAFQGPVKVGAFDIPGSLAQEMLNSPNPHGKSNAEVLSRWVNGRDITTRFREMCIIDFREMSLESAALYEAPFEYVNQHIRPTRERNNDWQRRTYWWRLGRSGNDLRAAVVSLTRFIVTPRVSKHRVFVWVEPDTLPDSAVVAIAGDDDYTFGVLHSRFHELWSLAMGTQLESRPRYTPTTCFETFPFPEPTEEQREAIGEAARELNELREGWLNPPGLGAAELKKRTLTNLYNNHPTWLDNAHKTLDSAVAAAYGWPADLGEQAVLERLLTLNLERAGAQ